MACKTKTLRATLSAFSDGIPGSSQYHSVFRVPVASWAKARMTIYVQGSSGATTVSSALAYGNKDADFNSPTAVDFPVAAASTVTPSDSVAYGSVYGTLDPAKQLVDFGVKCANASGTKMEHARVTLIVDLSE